MPDSGGPTFNAGDRCPDGTKTILKGVVYDPAGKRPVPSAVVWVAGDVVPPVPDELVCDPCSATISADIARVTTVDGSFTLEIPDRRDHMKVAFQAGKWRRIVDIDVNPCEVNELTDHDVTRLPRNQKEGNLPKIAISIGECDTLECLLRQVGVSDEEFTAPGGKGRVHLFKGNSSGGPAAGGFNDAPLSEDELWSDYDHLKKYDLVLMNCECDTQAQHKREPSKEAFAQYADAGGRVFFSHYHYEWLKNGAASWRSSVKTWATNEGSGDTTASIDVTFPEGQQMADWLHLTGASKRRGFLDVTNTREDILEVDPAIAKTWVYQPYGDETVDAGGEAPLRSILSYTFDAPVGVAKEKQCGRVGFSGMHVSDLNMPGKLFPAGCRNATFDLTPQEKALEFLLFNLTGCLEPGRVTR